MSQIQSQIEQASLTPTVQRANNLAQQAPWMPADMQMTLAQSQTSNGQLDGIVHSVKQVLSSTWNGFADIHDDPVLHKDPSAALTLTRMFSAAIGPLPIANEHLNSIQSQLQKQGYGAGLPLDGVWNSGWNGEYQRYAQDLRQQQMQASGPSANSQSLFHKFTSALIPSHILGNVVAAVKTFPGELRDLSADLVGGVTELSNLVIPANMGGGNGYLGGAAKAGAHAGYDVEKLLGNKRLKSSDQYARESIITGQYHRMVQDLGTIISVASLDPAGSATMTAAGHWAGGLDLAAAQRGPGVIAHSLFGGMSQERLASEAASSMSPLERQAIRGRALLNPQFARNYPLFNRIGPVVGKVADGDGAYYRLRTTLAAPYKYGQVRAIGGVTNVAQAASAGITGLAAVEGSQSPLSKSIDETQLSIDRIGQTHGAGEFIHGLDTLGLLLHGPGGDAAISKRIGGTVNNFVEHSTDALTRVGAPGAFELATGKSIQELQDAAGGPERLSKWMTGKVAEHAADHFVQDGLNKSGIEYGTPEYVQKSGQLANDIWGNPAEHITAMKGLLAHPYELSNLIRGEIVKSGNEGDAWLRSSMHDYLDAGGSVSSILERGGGKFLVSPNGRSVIANAKDAFDYGAGQEDPLRVSSMTRREYIRQHDDLLKRVSRQLVAARQNLSGELTQAQHDREAASELAGDAQKTAIRSAAQRVRQAQNRLTAFEDAVNAGDMVKVARVADRSSSAGVGSYLKSQYQVLINDVDRLRNHIGVALPKGEKVSLAKALSGDYNPDELYTALNGAARPIPAAVGTGPWLQEHLAHPDGAVGVGHVTSKVSQEAAADADRFEHEIAAANGDFEKTAQVVEQMKNYMFRHFNMDERALGVFDENPAKLVENLRDRAATLAAEVTPTLDAPQWVKDELATLKAAGWRVVLGQHIGHLWDGSTPSMDDIGAAISRRRAWANRLGLNPDRIEPRTAGTAARIGIQSEIQKSMRDPKFGTPPPRVTAQTITAVLREAVDSRLPLASHTAMTITRRFHKRGIDAMMELRNVDRGEAQKLYEAEIARTLQLRDIPRSEALKTLTTPQTITTDSGLTYDWPGLSPTQANMVWRGVQRGYTGRTYMMGAQAMEDWGRAGVGFLGHIADRNPNQDWLQHLANMPNQMVRLRNRMRFNLSVMFDLRRITKTNYKIGLEGVKPTWNPLARLMETGDFVKAHKLLQHLLGEQDFADADIADRYLHEQSVFGLYNARHYEAYFAHELSKEGKSDDEIRLALHKAFDYGDSKTGARNAIERTANTVFFPFSFEKTLVRNTGAYMLDHPGQAILLGAALDEYQKANKNDRITRWVNDHLPILHDLNKLNAFEHGIGPGEVGGINAPLLNLFLPQQWAGGYNKRNLQRFLPIFSDFGRVWKDAKEQARIADFAAFNASDWTLSHMNATGLAKAIDNGISIGGPFRSGKGLDPYRPTVTTEAQQFELAPQMRARMISQFGPVLAWNRSHPGDEYTFPMDPRLPAIVQGKAVNRENIGWLVHQWYPAYDPSSARIFAEQQAVQVKKFLAGVLAKGQAGDKTAMNRWKEYSAFSDMADKWGSWLNSDNYDKAHAQQAMTAFHLAAVNMSEADGQFYKFYNAHYRWLFGPLEEVTKLDSAS